MPIEISFNGICVLTDDLFIESKKLCFVAHRYSSTADQGVAIENTKWAAYRTARVI